jgi:hypothetical protein
MSQTGRCLKQWFCYIAWQLIRANVLMPLIDPLLRRFIRHCENSRAFQEQQDHDPGMTVAPLFVGTRYLLLWVLCGLGLGAAFFTLLRPWYSAAAPVEMLGFAGLSSSLDIVLTALATAGVDLATNREIDGINLLPGEKAGEPHGFLCWPQRQSARPVPRRTLLQA